MRFSIAYWHSFRGVGQDPFGPGTIVRPWETGKGRRRHREEAHGRRVRVLYQDPGAVLGPSMDRDIAPEGKSLAESNKNLDKLIAHAKGLQKSTGVKLLWGTANLFSNPRYMCGASTNPDAPRLRLRRRAGEEGTRGHEGTRRRELRLLGRSRRLRNAAQHQPQARAGPPSPRSCTWPSSTPRRSASPASSSSSPSPRSRPSTSTTSMSRAASPSCAPTASTALQVQHRDQPRHARRPHLQSRDRSRRGGEHARLDRRQCGDTLLGWDTDQFNTDVKELTPRHAFHPARRRPRLRRLQL